MAKCAASKHKRIVKENIKVEKEKFLTVVFMTIVSFVCSFFGDMIFGFFTDGGIGAVMGFLFPPLVVYWISKFFPNKDLHSDRDYDDMHSNQKQEGM